MMNRQLTIIASIFIVVGITVAVLTYSVFNSLFLKPAAPENTAVSVVEIPSGYGVNQIAGLLGQKNLIHSVFGFKLLYKLKGAQAPINAGEYELSPAMKPKEILVKLITGDVLKRKVLVKEGATIEEVALAVEQAGVVGHEEISKTLVDREFLKKAGVQASSFEGYLFPDTYFFSRPITAHEVVWKMFTEAEKHWPEEFSAQADQLRMTRHEVLTLASIIQKEAGNVEEMGTVSSVFHNRLNTGMKLQSDPTVIYGIKDFNGNITKADLERPTVYNTYTNSGLPPGPIACPGEDAVRAALFPKDTEYFYFVGDGKGRHIFSKNLDEHNAAVMQYQIRKQ